MLRLEAFVPTSFLFLVRPGAPNVASLLLVVRHLLLEAMHLFLVANLASSKARSPLFVLA